MSIERVRAEPCWELDRDPWESPHFDTRTAALARETADAARDQRRPVPGSIAQLAVPCCTAGCDSCGYHEGENDYGAAAHFPVVERRHVLVDLVELERDNRGLLLCDGCRSTSQSAGRPRDLEQSGTGLADADFDLSQIPITEPMVECAAKAAFEHHTREWGRWIHIGRNQREAWRGSAAAALRAALVPAAFGSTNRPAHADTADSTAARDDSGDGSAKGGRR